MNFLRSTNVIRNPVLVGVPGVPGAFAKKNAVIRRLSDSVTVLGPHLGIRGVLDWRKNRDRAFLSAQLIRYVREQAASVGKRPAGLHRDQRKISRIRGKTNVCEFCLAWSAIRWLFATFATGLATALTDTKEMDTGYG